MLVLGMRAASSAAAQLVVAIESNPGVAVPGEQLEVRITVSNQGGSNVAGVLLNLAIPAELDTFLTAVALPSAGGCTQITHNVACQSGETLIWTLGTIVAGQSVTVTIPNLYIAHPTADLGELFTLHAIPLGSGSDDRAVDQVVPEPGIGASLFAGWVLIAGLRRSREGSGRRSSPLRSVNR